MMVQMNVKINKRDLTLIHRVSEKRGEGSADFVRMSIRKELARLGFLTNEEMKALGVSD